MKDITDVILPNNPYFGSGPTRKNPAWQVDKIRTDVLGRSHRSNLGLSRIQNLLNQLRDVLQIPDTHHIALVNGGGTGAFEFLMWNLLTPDHEVDVFTAGVFGNLWRYDLEEVLSFSCRVFSEKAGKLPDFHLYQPDHDAVFVWTETTTGVTLPQISDNKKDLAHNVFEKRRGLTLCDATAATFCTNLPWDVLDAVGFSLQKGLGGEAGLGVIVMNHRALQRCQKQDRMRPRPRLFRLPRLPDGQIDAKFFKGYTINTISLWIVEDFLQALSWARSLSDTKPLKALIQRIENNYSVLKDFVQNHDWISFLVQDPEIRSHHIACLKLHDESLLPEVASFLSDHKIGFDILNHKLSVPALRIWMGPCIEPQDLEYFFRGLERAYMQAL